MKLKKYRLDILFVIFLISIILFFLNFFQMGFDSYWHISAGKFMVKNHTILTKDVFSWFLYGKKWFSHEWLYEIIIYYFNLIFVKTGNLIYVFVNILILFLVMYFSNRENIKKNINFSFIWFILSFILISFLTPRPHLISFIFIYLTTYLLNDLYYNEKSNKIFILPFIQLLWSNIHGGSSNLIYLLIIMYLFIGMFNFDFKKIQNQRLSFKQVKKYLICMILCILSICINPHGFSMITYPYINMGNSFMISTISEWQPTNFNDFGSYIFLIVFSFVLFILLFSKKKIRLLDLLIFGFSVFLGLKNIRFWAFVYLFSFNSIFYYVDSYKVKNIFYIKFSVIITCFLIIFVFNHNKIYKNLNNKVISDSAISYLKDHNPKRLYNYYGYGGYLISENIKVFVDGRCDLYSDYNYRDYYNISILNFGFDKLIKKYDFDYFIIPSDFGLSTYLSNNNSYQLVYKDKNTVIFKLLNN